MKPTLQLKIGQQLAMTPQLQQAIQLLQMSTGELMTEVQLKLDENPLLERDPDPLNEPLLESDDWERLSFPTAAGPAAGYEAPDKEETTTLTDHLLAQLQLGRLSRRDLAIGYCLIDALDERGYLTTDFDEIAQACARLGPVIDEPLETDEITAVLHRIQQFEPTGIAACNLTECLSLQLAALPGDTPHLAATKALLKHLGPTPAEWEKAAIDPHDATTARSLALLRQLDPAPGASYGSQVPDYTPPDIIVSKQEGRWRARLNPETRPRLSLSPFYANLASQTLDATTSGYLRSQMQEARWFIRSIESRFETLLKVASCILELQNDFFDYGPEAMRPLVLSEVADRIGMHESTISRVTTRKYMHTPRGLYELKYFFSSHVATKAGGECSSTAIHAIMKTLVAEEDPRKPLSDSRLAALLGEQGIEVARRTVAKYREALNIPASSARKRLF